jgi:prepilin signal peptidase PulO-like enzyme (type II secretory pathway)
VTTESFAVVGAIVGVVALVASQRLVTLVARDIGVVPARFPWWSYVGAVVVGAVSLARNENELAASTVLVAIVTALMLVQAPLDLATRRLSRSVTLCAVAGTAVVLALTAVTDDDLAGAAVAAAVAIAVVAVYALLHRWSPSSLGWGDVLLVVPLALAVGYVALDRVAVWQLLASATGALHALVARRLRGTGSIPFGPHLLVAAWLVLFASV